VSEDSSEVDALQQGTKTRQMDGYVLKHLILPHIFPTPRIVETLDLRRRE
jgi:hypothetical protein